MMMDWDWRSFQELNVQELYDLLALRHHVFTLEQQCHYDDFDYRDQASMHLLGKQHHQLIAYARLLPKGIAYPDGVSFGRIVIAKSARGKGLGKELVECILRYIEKHSMKDPIIISAQSYLKQFYESFGFQAISDPYEDAGILHIKMVKE